MVLSWEQLLRPGTPWVLDTDPTDITSLSYAKTTVRVRLDGTLSFNALKVVLNTYGRKKAPCLLPAGSLLPTYSRGQRQRHILASSDL